MIKLFEEFVEELKFVSESIMESINRCDFDYKKIDFLIEMDHRHVKFIITL